MLTIATIGAGDVGGALGGAFAERGHTVRYGVRDPAAPRHAALTEKSAKASVHAVSDAVAPADVVILATPWSATEAAIRSAGDLSGKILLDCTNPLVMREGSLALVFGHDDSGGETVARWAKGASVFKTFNTTGFSNMANAATYYQQPVMFVAGDDPARKPEVLELVKSLEFEPVDLGGLAESQLLEPLALIWITLAFKGFGRDFAFALARPVEQPGAEG